MAVSCQQFGLARKQTSVRRTGFRDLVASMSPNHTAVALMCYNAVKPHELLYIDRAKTEYLKSASSPIDSGSHFLKDSNHGQRLIFVRKSANLHVISLKIKNGISIERAA
jgi:hypothetical protein